MQAASRGSSGSISRIVDEVNTPKTSGPLVFLSDALKLAVSDALWRYFCSNLKQFAHVDVFKNRYKCQKFASGCHAESEGAPLMHL